MEVNWFITIPWLPAITTAAYLTVKKKSPSEIIENTVKAMLGYYLICAGAYLAIEAMSPLDARIYGATGTHVGVLNTELMGAVLVEKSGNAGFLTFLLAFAVNLLLARKLKKGYLFLTGHHLLFLSLMTCFVIREKIQLSPLAAAALGGMITGIYIWFCVRASAGCMEKLKPGARAGLGNSASGAAVIGTVAGRCFRKKKKLEYYGKEGRNTSFVTSIGVITVFVLYLVMPGTGKSLSEAARCALMYGAALSAIVYGLRMLLGNVIQMFWELGKRYVPDLVTGLDSTAIVSYSPGAWKAGFCAASVTAAIASLLLFVTGSPFAALPGFTSLYFAGGVAGVFGNMEGGKQGAALAGAVTGIAVILLTSGLVLLSGMGVGYGMALGETEYGLLGCLLSVVLNVIK